MEATPNFAKPLVESVTLTLTVAEANLLADSLVYTTPYPPATSHDHQDNTRDLLALLVSAIAGVPTLPAWHTEAAADCAAGKRILAIKGVRAATGWGLKEAKDYVDEHFPHVR